MRVCSACKLPKSVNAFYGNNSRCKACTAKHNNCRTSIHYQVESTELTQEQQQTLQNREQKRREMQAKLAKLGLL